MNYEEALKVWGANKLEEWIQPSTKSKTSIVLESVKVDLEFDEGYACCGGRDPDCYCSFAESPSANVEINGVDDRGERHNRKISHWDFDFATILKEIVEAGGGTVTNESDK